MNHRVSAVQIQMYLKGLDYPVNKKMITDHAKLHGAPDNVMSFLNRLPERQYNVPTDIEREIGRIKEEGG